MTLEEFLFGNRYSNRKNTPDRLVNFGDHHLGALNSKNPGGVFNTIIGETDPKIAALRNAISGKGISGAVQKGSTNANDTALDNFEDAVHLWAPHIMYVYRNNEPIRIEFFPHGLTEFDSMAKETALGIIDRFFGIMTAHVVDLDPDMITEITAARQAYIDTRGSQIDNISDTDTSGIVQQTARTALELQYLRNEGVVKSNFPGDIEACMNYFDYSLLLPIGAAHHQNPKGPISVNNIKIIIRRGITQTSRFILKNTTNSVLQFYLTDREDGLINGGVIRAVPANTTMVVTYLDFVNPGKYYLVVKCDGPEAGYYDVEMTED